MEVTMRCLVLLSVLMVCVAATSAASAPSCAFSEEYFARLNVSADESDGPGPTCGGQCCGRGREQSLRTALRRRVGTQLPLSTRPIASLLISTKQSLQEHLIELSHQSQNKTAVFFTQMYKGYAAKAHGPLSTLYEDIRSRLRSFSSKDPMSPEDFESPLQQDLGTSTRKFFQDVFPVVYHNVLRLDGKQFTSEYESCLKDAYDAAQPFGDVPHRFGTSLSRSLESARALLHALAVGAATLASSQQILSKDHDEICSTSLLRATGCAYCRGRDERPCRNYCLNVARGCVGSVISELDAPWGGYVEGVERMARVNDADATLRALDTKVSQAVMHALESQAILEKKVRQECGAPSTVEAAGPSSTGRTGSGLRRDAFRAPPPDTELLQFAASLAASRRLFAGLADRLCDDPDFAHDVNDNCWTGEEVGQYTKALVASASVSDQRYNPEVTGGAPLNPEVAALGDKLRQTRQMLISVASIGGDSPAAEAFMQGDEAGEGGAEGSGSGRSYDDDATYDAEGSGDTGSGSHSIDGRIYTGEETTDSTVPKTGSASVSGPVGVVVNLALLVALSRSLT